jgi:hypothetical protein
MRRILWLALLASSGAALALAVLPDAEADADLGADLNPKTIAKRGGDVALAEPSPPSLPTPSRERIAPTAVEPARAADAPPVPRRQNWPAPSSAAQAAWSAPAPPPPPPRAAPPPPEPAKPPPFPYQWLGRMEDGEQPAQIFLGSPQRSYAVAEGQSPDQQWRIDRVVDGQLQVTWLATGDTVTVAPR